MATNILHEKPSKSNVFLRKPSSVANKDSSAFSTKSDFFVRSQQSAVANSKIKVKQNSATSRNYKDNQVKKPFNKSKWREEKYSVKHKIDTWKDNRKKVALRRYKKENKTSFDVQKIYEEEEQRNRDAGDESDGTAEDTYEKPGKRNLKPHEKFLLIQDEKLEKKFAIAKLKAEKEEALKKSKKEKLEKYKKLNKKTRKGQPVMKGRLEHLLEKIENNKELYSSSG